MPWGNLNDSSRMSSISTWLGWSGLGWAFRCFESKPHRLPLLLPQSLVNNSLETAVAAEAMAEQSQAEQSETKGRIQSPKQSTEADREAHAITALHWLHTPNTVIRSVRDQIRSDLIDASA